MVKIPNDILDAIVAIVVIVVHPRATGICVQSAMVSHPERTWMSLTNGVGHNCVISDCSWTRLRIANSSIQ